MPHPISCVAASATMNAHGPASLAYKMQDARWSSLRTELRVKRRTEEVAIMDEDLTAAVIRCAEHWAAQLDRAAAAHGTPAADQAEEALLGAIVALLDAVTERQAALGRIEDEGLPADGRARVN